MRKGMKDHGKQREKSHDKKIDNIQRKRDTEGAKKN